MKKITAILLLLVYFSGATNAYELLKLPLLIQHFAQHKKLNPDITIAQFFKIHYIDEQVRDNDYSDDMKLPFKTTEEKSCHPVSTTLLPAPFQGFIRMEKIITREYTVNNDKVPVFLYCASLFQPPRLA